jgi:hypothetical protein
MALQAFAVTGPRPLADAGMAPAIAILRSGWTGIGTPDLSRSALTIANAGTAATSRQRSNRLGHTVLTDSGGLMLSPLDPIRAGIAKLLRRNEVGPGRGLFDTLLPHLTLDQQLVEIHVLEKSICHVSLLAK